MRELRYLKASEMRVVRSADGKTVTVGGYASVFNSRSEDLGGFTEIVAPGAFKRTLTEQPDVVALYHHDPSAGILGRTSAGTLRLSEDDKGLAFECDLPDTTLGRDIAVSVERRDLNACSFGFYTKRDSWDATNDDDLVRTLQDVDLVEVTITAFPAYPASSVGMRSKLFPDGTVEVPKRALPVVEDRSDDNALASILVLKLKGLK